MPETCVFVGSHANAPAQGVSITANAVTETVTVPAGSRYALPATWLADAILSHSEVTACTVNIRQDGRLVIATTPATSINSAPTGILSLMTGFTTSRASASSHVADVLSSYMWIPYHAEIAKAPLGIIGLAHYDTVVGRAAPGRVIATQNYVSYENEFRFRFVENTRVWTTDEDEGEFVIFHRNVLRTFSNFNMYRGLEMSDSSSSTVTLNTPLGPYIWNPTRDVRESFDREIDTVESYVDVRVPCVSAAEYEGEAIVAVTNTEIVRLSGAYNLATSGIAFIDFITSDENTTTITERSCWLSMSTGRVLRFSIIAASAPGNTTVGFHLGLVESPAVTSVTVNGVGASTYTVFDFSEDPLAVFDEGDRISISVDPTSTVNGVQWALELEVDV